MRKQDLDLIKSEIVESQGYKFLVGNKHSYVVDEIKKLGFYENKIEDIKKHIRPNSVCLDIGANFGYYSILMSGLCKRVFSFEPEPYNFNLLQANITQNQCHNVIPQCMAVGNDNTIMDMYLSKECTGMHRLYPSKYTTDETIRVIVRRLDDSTLLGEDISFVKIDVEGSEFGVLKGMEKILDKDLTIYMEFVEEGQREYGSDPKEVLGFLESKGFNIEKDGRNIWCRKK